MRLDYARPRRRLISLTPLIDVVFILLVFFMLASNLVEWRSIALSAPATSTSHAEGDAWLLRVHPERLEVNGRELPMSELAETAAERLREHPDQPLLVQPASMASLQRVVDIVDRLHGAGARDIRLLRLPAAAQRPDEEAR